MGLLLEMVEVADHCHWRWLLRDESTGAPLADHTVAFDPAAPEAVAFADLYRHLRANAVPDRRVSSETELLTRAGAWIGTHVLGERVGRAIVDAAPVAVRVTVPPEGALMVFRPLELAHVDGVPLASRGEVSLVFDLGPSGAVKRPVADRLRVLAVFSLPTEQDALALRRERYELTRLIRRITARERRVVELRVLQYGATRARLAEIVEEGDGWDVLHLSGHGGAGTFLLEKDDGSPDRITTPELVELLRPARKRLKLAVVSACQSGAATTAETLRWLRLEEQAHTLEQQVATEAASGVLTAIGPELVRRLDCAVVAMRYPVVDGFAITFADQLYERLLSKGQPLDEAVCRAVAKACGPSPSPARPPLSVATPALFGSRAAGLNLTPPRGEPLVDVRRARMSRFPREPERFVGRAGAMAKASAALASSSGRTAVLLHGMAGAGKTSCAVELAYRHQDSFAAAAFWQAPVREEEFGTAVASLALALEDQLDGFSMVDKVTSVEQLQRFLPRLRRTLEEVGILLVLDNLETLLTPAGTWRDPRWGPLMEALTGHDGESRVILTSRIPPAGLGEPTTLVLPIHALSRDESLALARELPRLGALLHADGGPLRRPAEQVEGDRELVRRVLTVVQGHPKLLELADAAAEDPETLKEHLAAAETAAVGSGGTLTAFFRDGESALDGAQFLDVLEHWTRSTLTTLPAPAALLARVLACVEENDRWSRPVEATWNSLCRQLGHDEPPDLTAALDTLVAAAIVQLEPTGPPGEDGLSPRRYRLHPGVAESIRATADPALQNAVDIELSALWITLTRLALEQEGGEAGQVIVHAGLAAVPYLLRREMWDPAASLLEQVTHRDYSLRTTQTVASHLRRIVDATGTPDNLGILAKALRRIDPAEAERLLHDALAHTLDKEDFSTACGITGTLINILRDAGRLHEALELVEKMADYTRKAGLGPWSQLQDQSTRLQLLTQLGEHEQILTEVDKLRQRMADLPDKAAPNDTVIPWNVREMVLGTGHAAAIALERWTDALALNAEILASLERRNAGVLEFARYHFNDYGPLLYLNRLNEAEQLLLEVQEVFRVYEDLLNLSRVFAARANLESERDRPEVAVTFQKTSIRYAYHQHPLAPVTIAAYHHNLANYLAMVGAAPAEQRAHRLAAAILYHLISRGHLPANVTWTLAVEAPFDESHELPRTVTDVVRLAELTEGVRLGALIAALAPDPETAETALADILHAAATYDFSSEEAATIRRNIENWTPVIAEIVAAANGDREITTTLEPHLDQLGSQDDWAALVPVLRRIIAGERDDALLTGLDPIDTAIVREVLTRLGGTDGDPQR